MTNKRKILIMLASGIFIILAICCSHGNLHAQETNNIKFPERVVSLHAGFSQHLSQSINGFSFGIGHEINMTKKISLFNNISFTVHDGKERGYSSSLPNLAILTASNPWYRGAPLKFITAGVQTSAGISINIFKGKIWTGAGPLLRYQTSSKPEDYNFNIIMRQTTTGPQYSTNYVINSIRPHSFSTGAIAFTEILMFKTKTFSTKAQFVYQFDSQGDKIISAGINLQKTYKKTS